MRFAVPVVTLDTKNAPAFSATEKLNGIDATNEITATTIVSVKICKMIFSLLLPMESKIPISFLRPLIQIVSSRVSITTLTTEIIIIVIFTSCCRDSKGVETTSYSSVSMLSFKDFPRSSDKFFTLS